MYDLRPLQALSEVLQDMVGMYNNGTSSLLEDALQTCTTNGSAILFTPNDTNLNGSIFWNMTHSCASIFVDLNDTFFEALTTGIDTDFTALIHYEENLKLLFGDNYQSPSWGQYLYQPACPVQRRRLFEKRDSLKRQVDLALELLVSNSATKALHLAVKITGSFEEVKFTEEEAVHIRTNCREFEGEFEWSVSLWEQQVDRMQSFEFSESTFSQLRREMFFFQRFLENAMKELVDQAEMSITDAEAQATTSEFQQVLERLRSLSEHLSFLVNNNMAAIASAEEVINLHTLAPNAPINVLNSSNFGDTNLFLLAANHIPNSEIQTLLYNMANANVSFDKFYDLFESLNVHIFNIGAKLDRRQQTMVTTVHSLRSALTTRQKMLDKYEDQTDMNTNFYL